MDVTKFRATLAAVALLGWVAAPHSPRAAGQLEEADDGPGEPIASERPLASGEVVAVDRGSGSVTVRCRPIPELHMTETTTMIFHVADGSMLEGLTPGDKIRFRAERTGVDQSIVRLEHSN